MFAYTTRAIEAPRRTAVDRLTEMGFTFAQTYTFTPRLWLRTLSRGIEWITRLTVPFEDAASGRVGVLDPDRGLTMEAMIELSHRGCKRSEWTGSEPDSGVIR
ncbi:hypothetical protein HVO_1422A [Haloferax volcanii DS2]|uniref:Uncharacterized protein n=1 Tax=Haloferax volcanii (strain ATCC 29605 / DSM 3757 / JCM 8879 / NBRC 14742 / NCIMB 2012 / VKM B-1768 / DS2) TaxID=309800 RepID=A0A1C9J6U6_HALVD|nr:hypothetical protein HVO_1422A [Haloferax volcanii DS2]